MKKLFLFLGFVLFGCSEEKNNDCKCTAKYTNVANNTSYYVSNTPIDCETQYPIDNQEGGDVWYMGCVEN
jgi:hypothetical protein